MITMDESHFVRLWKCVMRLVVYEYIASLNVENPITSVSTDEEMEVLLQHSPVLFFCVYVGQIN